MAIIKEKIIGEGRERRVMCAPERWSVQKREHKNCYKYSNGYSGKLCIVIIVVEIVREREWGRILWEIWRKIKDLNENEENTLTNASIEYWHSRRILMQVWRFLRRQQIEIKEKKERDREMEKNKKHDRESNKRKRK